MFSTTCLFVFITGAVTADPSEFRTIAAARDQFCNSAVFSPDGELILALRAVRIPNRKPTYHVDLWKVADVEAFDGSATRTPHPAATAELKDCEDVSIACFSKDGEVVVQAKEIEKNGYSVGSGSRVKAVTAAQAELESDAGRRVSRISRPVTLFLTRDGLQERRRWVDDRLIARGNLSARLIWFPAGRTVVDGGSSGVRLLDDSTGEEYSRLTFELERPNDPWGGLGDAQITQVDARTCVIVAIARQRHAVWKLSKDRTVTKLAEVQHPGITQRSAASPLGNVVAVAALSSDHKWGRNSPPISESGSRGSLELRQVESPKPQSKLLADDLVLTDLKFSSDGKRLAAIACEVIAVDDVPLRNKPDS